MASCTGAVLANPFARSCVGSLRPCQSSFLCRPQFPQLPVLRRRVSRPWCPLALGRQPPPAARHRRRQNARREPGSTPAPSTAGEAVNRGKLVECSATQNRSLMAQTSGEDRVNWGDFFKGDLPKKFGVLLIFLAISRVGIYIPLWGVDRDLFQSQLGDNSLLSTLDTLSGGGIGRLGLFSLGIVPYINAQIVFQLFGVLYPKIQEMQRKEGEAGRKKAQNYTKILAVGFAILQAIGQVAYLQQYAYEPSPGWAISAVVGLTLGSAAVVYLGDKITDLKLGNGTSLLIFTNIVSYLPASIGRTISEAQTGGNEAGEAGLIVAFLVLVFGIVYVQEAERRIPINYAQSYRGPSKRGLSQAYLPFKVNSSGVMPIIFSSSLMAAPASLARFTSSVPLQSAAFSLNPGGPLYLPVSVAMIAFFNYFYTFLQLDPDDLSDQLKRQGASIPSVRPGKATSKFITGVLGRISVLGSLFLGIMATAPTIVEAFTSLTAFRGFAGTSVLILVGCATDTARKVQAELVSQKYKTIDLDDYTNIR